MAKQFIVETSARHVHVTKETLAVLFGADAVLHNKKNLSQPGQFASTDKIEVLGYNDPRKDPEGKLPRPSMKFSILGPVRDHNQVEVSLTEARKLGVNAPVRESGDIAGSGACTLVGPAGQVDLKEGVICAKRHIHMTPEDAERFGVSNGQIVGVKVDSGKGRAVIFEDTVVRVSPKYALAMHIDTDESNACCGSGLLYGEIVSK